jgi:hypothetical protein
MKCQPNKLTNSQNGWLILMKQQAANRNNAKLMIYQVDEMTS